MEDDKEVFAFNGRYKTAYDYGNMDYSTSFEGKSKTKQYFRKECDINNIMARFQKTGVIDHFTTYGHSYGEVPAIDLQEALNIAIDAEDMFDDLPSSIRDKFRNNPVEFLEFVQNQDNIEEMRELGLARPLPTVPDPGAVAEGQPTSSEAPAGD